MFLQEKTSYVKIRIQNLEARLNSLIVEQMNPNLNKMEKSNLAEKINDLKERIKLINEECKSN